MICPSCAYREADCVTGFCGVCTGQLTLGSMIRLPDGVAPCRRCGSVERNSGGDCAPCHRRRERRRWAELRATRPPLPALDEDLAALAELAAHVRAHLNVAEQIAFELWENHRDFQRWHQRDRGVA